ncbi:MAG: HlyC/CorC family transporter [Niastella sp.]|nr:HlyC/CorC family transporter [Niastella sp.]
MTEILIVLFLIFLNGLFVIAEISLVSSRRSRLEAWANKGDRKAKSALDLAENPERFLSTVQIGITLISILTGVYTGEKFGGHLKPYIENIEIFRPYAGQIATAIVVIIVTFFSIIFGELIPKKFGLLRAEKIARAAATPMNFLSRLMMPFVWLLSKCTNFIFKILKIKASTDNAVTEEEIKAMVAEGSEYGSIDEEEKEIIERVFHLGDRNITSLMTHRTDIVWLDINDSVQEIKQKLNTIVFNTYPVCEESIDNIKGLVYVKDLLKATPETKLNQLIKEALFVPENNKAYQLLEKMKAAKIHTAFIVNEYGTLEGMITLNDILEAIVGDVPQTDQEEYEIIKRDDGSYLVDAQIHFYDFLSYFERADWMNEGEHDFDTVAGFVLHELEHIPHEGEIIEWKDFKFEILDMDGQRIDKILVTISQELKQELEEA